VRKLGLLGGDATEGDLDAAELANERAPHLEDRIGKSELEDAARDRGDHRLVAHIDAAPRLLLVPALGVKECAGVARREFCRSLDAVDLESPFVGRAGREAAGLVHHREDRAVFITNVAEKKGIVPGLAGNSAALAVGSLGDDVRKLRKNVERLPAHSEGDVLCVKSEVAHTAVLTVDRARALPVDRLVQIHIARVAECRADLDDLAESALADPFDQLLAGGVEGELARTANHNLGMSLDGIHDRAVCFKVDAEGFFAEEVLARIYDVNVDLLVQIVRNGAIYGVDVVFVEKLSVVRGRIFDAVEIIGEPVSCVLVYVGNANDHGRGDVFREMAPSCRRGGKFATHKSTADNGKSDLFLIHFITSYS